MKVEQEEESKDMKKVLITGANSYIGDSVRDYLLQFPDEYSVSVKDTRNWTPSVSDFKDIDVVYHVAGIAHRRETRSNVHLYYEINKDLAIQVAKKAKEAGVSQFILMSTMSVYGLTTGFIKKSTKPNPKSHYGKSKLQADRVIWKMRDDNFKVAILRPPMVYGKGCKGNYQRLKKFVLKSPIFLNYKNQRSMIYIGNLCEFVKECVNQERRGLFFPQNAEYTNTSEMVRIIAECNDKKIRMIGFLSWAIRLSSMNVVKKVFGDLVYEKVDMVGKFDFWESIFMTEGD